MQIFIAFLLITFIFSPINTLPKADGLNEDYGKNYLLSSPSYFYNYKLRHFILISILIYCQINCHHFQLLSILRFTTNKNVDPLFVCDTFSMFNSLSKDAQ